MKCKEVNVQDLVGKRGKFLSGIRERGLVGRMSLMLAEKGEMSK